MSSDLRSSQPSTNFTHPHTVMRACCCEWRQRAVSALHARTYHRTPHADKVCSTTGTGTYQIDEVVLVVGNAVEVGGPTMARQDYPCHMNMEYVLIICKTLKGEDSFFLPLVSLERAGQANRNAAPVGSLGAGK